ncbi:MAG TPA: exodeoxyribonuclease VII small subunit [Candidatus Sulfomarinibacteraceae bacterium]|nr:exodeoxyribonuclease VII small subunit [Candidatus Sulfomarinibacteraceae bacterium]
MSNKSEQLSFEEALAELERIVEKLESGDLSLEESLALFEKGQALARQCNEQLESATLRVEQLTEDGELIEVTVE